MGQIKAQELSILVGTEGRQSLAEGQIANIAAVGKVKIVQGVGLPDQRVAAVVEIAFVG